MYALHVHARPSMHQPVCEGPHHAAEVQAFEGNWADHGRSIWAIPFVCRKECRCSCCEKPLDVPVADDLYVVYCRWDNRLKRHIPVCMRDHDFGEPPFYYRNGGFETLEEMASWTLGITALVVLILLATSSSREEDGVILPVGMVLVAVGPLILVCLCAGWLWQSGGSSSSRRGYHYV